jgi:aldehyde:ferredoxin oxidoreductase
MIDAVMGKILWVDLSRGICTEESIPDWVYERFLSGMGLAAYLLYQRIPPRADPLGPENILGFVSGLLAGTGSMMTGRWMLVGKSPLTGTWGDANCGGTLSAAIKHNGYDGIFFTGISPRPVYLALENGHPELRDAAHLWGLDTRQTELELQKTNPRQRPIAACIGPAGERLSLIAGVSNDGGRMAARSGLGAVMGSKKLKAVLLRGKAPIRVHNPEEMKRLSKVFNRWAGFQPPFLSGKLFARVGTLLRLSPLSMKQDGMLYKTLLSRWGTVAMNQASIEMGDAPIQNWRGSNADFPLQVSSRLNPDQIRSKEMRKYRCRSCTVGCGGILRQSDGSEIHKPEYETVLALSGLLMNSDMESIYRIHEQLNRAGMDSISAGGTIAFAMECFEKGLITKEDTGGIELSWGNSQAVEALVHKMILREGIGDVLADGSRRAAERIGRGAEAFAVTAGGQELAMHDGRNDPGFTLHAVVEPTPGRHTMGSYLYYEMFQLWTRVKGLPPAGPLFYPKGKKYTHETEKATWAAACSQFMSLANGAGLCLFGGFIGVNRLPIFEWLNAATGWKKSAQEYLQIGWNIQTLRQAFNAREGLPLRHTVHPRAAGIPPLRRGANAERSVPLERLVPAYWEKMGWNIQTGEPDPAEVERLLSPGAQI